MVCPWRMLTNLSASTRCSSQKARAQRRSEAGLILLVPHFLACNAVFGRGLASKGQGQPGSGAFKFAIRLRDMTCTDNRLKGVGGL